MRFRFCWVVVCGLAAGAGFVGDASAVNYHVAPTGGNDANDGSINSPFATIEHGIDVAAPGDTVFLRGGTFDLNTRIRIQNKSGTEQLPIKLHAFPGETPVLDFAGQAEDSASRGIQINNSANYWQFKGLTIQNAGDNGLYTEGDYGVFDQIVTRWNRDSGFQLHTTASYNLVLNCDSYENYDPGNRGENADGFAVKSPTVGPGNIFRGDRAWGNSDDGWDMFGARANGVMIDNSWAFDNGVDPEDDPETFDGDGNGFKLGHDSGSHVLVRVAAWDHPAHGIDINGNGFIYNGNTPDMPNGSLSRIFNSTAYNNGLDEGANFYFDENLPHVLRNNVSMSGGVLMALNLVQQLNTWNNIPVDDQDFITLDDERARGPRRADGSLPFSDFLRLELDSNLVDIGTPFNFEFAGKIYTLAFQGEAPDLGAFEAGSVIPSVPGDYNGDFVVDGSDYTVWRNSFGETGPGLAADGSRNNVVDQADYALWKSHFGETLDTATGAGATSAVPEPSGWLLIAAAFLALAIPRIISRQRRFFAR